MNPEALDALNNLRMMTEKNGRLDEMRRMIEMAEQREQQCRRCPWGTDAGANVRFCMLPRCIVRRDAVAWAVKLVEGRNNEGISAQKE